MDVEARDTREVSTKIWKPVHKERERERKKGRFGLHFQ